MIVTRKVLEEQSKSWLIDRLLELAMIDANADRIMLSLSAENAQESKIIADFKQQIDKAVEVIEEHGPG